MRVGVEWQVQHKTKWSGVFDTRPHHKYCFFCTSRVNSALTDILFMWGRLSVAVVMHLKNNMYKRIKEIVCAP